MNKITSELLQELSKFEGREKALRELKRWSIRNTMFYRQSDFSHSKRVAWLVEHLSPLLHEVLGEHFDIRRTLALALVHDDPEIITGDYQAGDKAVMSKEQLDAIDKEEREAIGQLASTYPKTLGGYVYAELLEDMIAYTTLEARVAKYMDMFDAFGEGLHELYAGNYTFAEYPVTKFGKVPRFDVVYESRREKLFAKHMDLEKLAKGSVIFAPFIIYDWDEVAKKAKPHTKESIGLPAGHPQYDAWRTVVLNSGDSEEIKNLYTQREFLKSWIFM